MLKVLQVNKFNYLRGGADKYFLDISKELEQAGFEVAKFCMHHPHNLPSKYEQYFLTEIDFNNFQLKHIFKYLTRIIYSLEAKKKFAKLVHDFQPDIIHLHNIYHQISPAILSIAKKKNIPVVLHVHDYKIVCPNYKMYNNNKICEKCRQGQYYHCALNRCLKQSFFKSLLATIEMYIHHKVLKIYEKNIDLYVAPTEFVKSKLIEWGIPEEKIVVLLHYLETKEFQPSYDLGNYLLYFGRLSPEKGIDVLIQAMTKVKDIKLKIVGVGSEYKKLQEQIDFLDLKGKVELLGPKSRDDLLTIIKNSFAVVIPSQWYEVFGLVNLEAAALGKLVIASNIGGIPETVINKETALLFNPYSLKDLEEKTNWALDNPEQVKEMGRAGRKFVENNFTLQKHLRELLTIYNSVLKK